MQGENRVCDTKLRLEHWDSWFCWRWRWSVGLRMGHQKGPARGKASTSLVGGGGTNGEDRIHSRGGAGVNSGGIKSAGTTVGNGVDGTDLAVESTCCVWRKIPACV